MSTIIKDNIEYQCFHFAKTRFRYVRVFNKGNNDLKWKLQDLFYSNNFSEIALCDIPVELGNELEQHFSKQLSIV
jgi:hypothetical protein